jgi:plastocyanin
VFAVILVVAGLPAVPADAWNGAAAGQVAIADFYFQPQSLAIAPGTTVTWVNHGPSQHTTTADNGAWNSGALNSGGTYAVLFNTAGTYTYHCAIHPQMVATIVVGGQPTSTQPQMPPPFGYSPYGSAPGYMPYGYAPGYMPYGYAPGYMPYAPQPAYPPYGYPPGYMPYQPYTPYAAPPPGMVYPGYPGYHYAHW